MILFSKVLLHLSWLVSHCIIDRLGVDTELYGLYYFSLIAVSVIGNPIHRISSPLNVWAFRFNTLGENCVEEEV